MSTIITRAGKGTPLTHAEVDANFTNLNTDKLDTAGIALGSAASPTIKFTGDTNTGIYSPGADAVGLSTGGSERMRITSSGYVGIGTNQPQSTLDISQSTSGTSSVFRYTGSTGGGAEIRVANGFSSTMPVYGFWFNNTTGIGNPSANETSIIGGGFERLRIDSSGRLLVGTSSSLGSTAKLVEVANSIAVSTYINNAFSYELAFNKSRGASNGTIVVDGDEIGKITFRPDNGVDTTSLAASIRGHVDGTPSATSTPGRLVFTTCASGSVGSTERMRITAAGNIGIGDTSPDTHYGAEYRLVVRKDQNAPTRMSVTNGTIGANAVANYRLIGGTVNSYTGIGLADNNGAPYSYIDAGTGVQEFRLNVTGTERMRIDSSGRLLVGTSSARSVGSATASLLEVETPSLGISCIANRVDQVGAVLALGKSRGTNSGDATIVQSNDILGEVRFAGADGVNAQSIGASINAQVDAAPGASDMPCRLVFNTTPDGFSSPSEAFRITNDRVQCYNQAAPAAVDTTATLTVANLKTGIITSTTAAAVTMTLPTGTLMDGGFSGLYANMTFKWTVINTGATNAVTVAAGTGHTIVGSATVAASDSACFASRYTAAATWVTYRLSS